MNEPHEKIIIVDDEKRMCDSLKALLVNEGYSVEAYQDPREAEKRIKASRVDLVITDIKMPQMDGLSLLKIIKKIDNDIPVILLTGYASLDSAVEAISHGAYDYLMKPVGFPQLSLAVKRAVEKRRADIARLALLEELKISNIIMHRRINELNALYEAGKSIGSSANLKELLKQIVSLASNVTEAKVGSIMLLDERGETLTIEASIGLSEKIVKKTRLPIGESIAGSVALSGESLVIEDVENDDKFKRINKERYGSASLLCVPLKIKNKVRGVINMANKQSEGSFTKNDMRLLTTFAAQAAVAVDDAHQFEKITRRVVEFKVLHEMTNELPQISSLNAFREKLLEKLTRVFPIDYSIWFVWDKDNQILIADSVFGLDNIPLTTSGKIDLKKNNINDFILKPFDKNFDFTDDINLTHAVAEKMKDNAFLPNPQNAYLGVPIFRYGELAFIFFIGSDEKKYYTEDDISLAKLVVSQTAILFEKEKTLLNATRLLTMGNMISEISHDLRKPLTTIRGGLQIIRSRWLKEAENSELFQSVEDEVLRLNELVRELVDFSNPNKYQTEKVDLRNVVNKAIELVQPDLAKNSIDFSVEYEDISWKIIINKNQILELLLNLFINAIDSMSNGGKMKIVGKIEKPDYKKDDYLALKVTDTGVGIKKENVSKIFDRYFTTKTSGTGLGLAVVERIISAHNGTLNVKSEYGKGTTFTIYFPLNKEG